MPAATRTRRDVDRQRQLDGNWGATQDLLAARIVAVLAARRALSERQVGAVFALRQSLIDLSAVSAALATDLAHTSR